MKYQIDQSGKIEQTNKDTILCLANGTSDSVLIKAKTKRQTQEVFRRNGQIRNYVLFTFCAGIFLLLKKNPKIGKVIIDREYYGKESIIKEIVLELLRGEKHIPEIVFENIGRKVNAHKNAYFIYNKKQKPGETLYFDNILKTIKKTEVGKRLKNA